MSLFNRGQFTLHSGAVSDFKIDCDFLDLDSLEAIGYEMVKRLPPFRHVEGVPRGGLALATVLLPWSTGKPSDPLLIVDDVYTTGTSMEAHRAGRDAIGAVIFARRVPKQPWISALFVMSYCSQDE